MSQYDPEQLEEAIGWATWCMKNTEIPMERILRSAKKRFGVPMAPIKRALYDLLGETMIQARARKLALAHSPNPAILKEKFIARATNRRSVERIERDAKKHIEEIKNS